MLMRMLSKDGEASSKASIPAAMALITTGLLFLGVSLAWRAMIPADQPGWSGSDFLKGFLLGIAIVLETAGVVIAVAAARQSKKSS